jgi:hypothetical protein
MSPKQTQQTEAPVSEETKPKKVTARDQGVPEVYLNEETGTFRPGYDAKLKSDLIVAILGDGRLYDWTPEAALEVLEARGWMRFLEESKAARERKAGQ